jgi:hypothetical protein
MTYTLTKNNVFYRFLIRTGNPTSAHIQLVPSLIFIFEKYEHNMKGIPFKV